MCQTLLRFGSYCTAQCTDRVDLWLLNPGAFRSSTLATILVQYLESFYFPWVILVLRGIRGKLVLAYGENPTSGCRWCYYACTDILNSAHTLLHRCSISIHMRPCGYGSGPNFNDFITSPPLAGFKMNSTPSNNPPAGNLQPDIYAAVIITLILAVTAVALRFIARRLVKASIWLDDWLTLVALVRYSSIQEFHPSSIITSFQVYDSRFWHQYIQL